jgi:hypothetical protein
MSWQVFLAKRWRFYWTASGATCRPTTRRADPDIAPSDCYRSLASMMLAKGRRENIEAQHGSLR